MGDASMGSDSLLLPIVELMSTTIPFLSCLLLQLLSMFLPTLRATRLPSFALLLKIKIQNKATKSVTIRLELNQIPVQPVQFNRSVRNIDLTLICF